MSKLFHRSPAAAARRRQHGFSLIEVMVGLVIAMVGVVIMMEVLITSEERTRTTGAGTDATSNGAIMMHLLQRDLAQAGFGINTVNLLGCTITLPSGKQVPLAPVVINPATSVIPASDPDTDRLLVFYGNDNGQPEGNEVFAVTGTAYTVQSPASFRENDRVVAWPNGCTAALTLARVTGTTGLTVTVDTATAGAKTLYNLGQAPRVVAYMVKGGALVSCDYMASDCSVYDATRWTALGGNVASLRAQYGHDTAAGAMDGTVDAWDQTTPTNACGWVRTSAVRYALVARSAQYESKLDSGTGQRVGDTVTAAAPTWNGSADTPIDLSKNPDGSTNADWQAYRYRTFQNVAPARNTVWMAGQSGC
jgi:type IV pilus assembly protein PilW